MEIDFNPSRIARADLSQPLTRTSSTPAASDAASFSTATSLTDRVSELPLVRSDKVASAQAMVSHAHYPPDDLLDRIAVLLALHLTQ
ncbi:MAG: hypothetical protein U1F98_09870 [Verrucomicrobiota bacterium]